MDGFHFTYADGTRYRPWGTTAYAWNHQDEPQQEATLDTLAASPFTKLRMCLFPKHFVYNTDEPERFPFPRAAMGRSTTPGSTSSSSPGSTSRSGASASSACRRT